MKILYVSTISNTVNAFLIPHIRMLIEQGHQVDLAFNINQEVNCELNKMGCKVYNLDFERSPLKKKNYLAYKKLKQLIEDEQYDLVHTHTPVASACVRLACRKVNGLKVIYTAHGFHFYKGAPLKNWLLYYPLEKLLSKYTDVLITINKEDYQRANLMNAKEVRYIPGVGVDIQKYNHINIDKVRKKQDLSLPVDSFVLTSVGELNDNKNHEIIIKALSKLENKKIYYVICGEGARKAYLKELAKSKGLDDRVKLLGFRNDTAEIYKITDLFVFPSKREGLPVSLIEAMGTGLPCLVSNIRGNVDLIENNKGGYLCDPNDYNTFLEKIKILEQDKNSLKKMGYYNQNQVRKYDIAEVICKMEGLYEEI